MGDIYEEYENRSVSLKHVKLQEGANNPDKATLPLFDTLLRTRHFSTVFVSVPIDQSNPFIERDPYHDSLTWVVPAAGHIGLNGSEYYAGCLMESKEKAIFDNSVPENVK